MVSFTELAGLDQGQGQQASQPSGYSDFLMQMLPMAQQQSSRNRDMSQGLGDPLLRGGNHPQSPLGLPPGQMPPGMPPGMPMGQMPPQQMAPPMPQQPMPPQQQVPDRGVFLAMMREGRARGAR